MKKAGSILWGVIFIIVGIIFGLNALNITNISIFFDGWWTLFIIIPCFRGLFSDSDKTGSIIGIVIGSFLLLACQDIISFDIILSLLFPCILVIIGLSIIFKGTINSKINKEVKNINNNNKDKSEYAATFSGQNINFDGEKFNGTELTAVFGGVKCDLRNAIIDKDVVIEAEAIFGGIDIYVPSNVKVKIKTIPIFGGVSNKANLKNDDKSVTIYINATAIFGGVDIK